MAFTGDLEHLPIVDLIQLMNSTRKTGMLTVTGRKGESQLIFKDGYIVSASHLNNSTRIGDVLIEKGFITAEQLALGLQRQQVDGANRRPLAITLIEMGIIREQDAHKGLQSLIEMTVVEILTWKSGKFMLTHLTDSVECDFKYYPEKMSHEININTQGILMDALRIFDEKKRDGLIEEETDEPVAADPSQEEAISVDDLGLSELDQLSDTLPQAFSAVAPFDPVRFQQEKLQSIAPAMDKNSRDTVARFLADCAGKPCAEPSKFRIQPQFILAATDTILIYALDVAASACGVNLTPVASGEELSEAIESAMLNGGRVSVVFDAPGAVAPAQKDSLSRARNVVCERYPKISCLQLIATEPITYSLEALRCGVRTVIPRPIAGIKPDVFADELLALVGFLPKYLAAE